MSNLADFLSALASDTQKLQSFRQNPLASMQAAGLTESEKSIVTSGDPVKIRNAMGAVAEGTTVVVVVAVL